MNYQALFVGIVIFFIVLYLFLRPRSKKDYEQGQDYHQNPNSREDDDLLTDAILRATKSRRSYYRDVYLKSKAWQRKRYVVLRRDNWRCVYCGQRATEVHHKKYAPKNIGKEPIEWLVSVCRSCHDSLHH
jgi:hypothetical protein